MASVTIHQLEVHFQVEGNDDAVFARLFERHINAWSRAHAREADRRARTEQERSIGDRGAGR
jgi:Zn-dependent protease with chaperone function